MNKKIYTISMTSEDRQQLIYWSLKGSADLAIGYVLGRMFEHNEEDTDTPDEQ